MKGEKDWSCQNICDALSYLFDNICVYIGLEFCSQLLGIPIGTSCTPLVTDCFVYCNERDTCSFLLTNIKLMSLKHPNLFKILR